MLRCLSLISCLFGANGYLALLDLHANHWLASILESDLILLAVVLACGLLLLIQLDLLSPANPYVG